eukprot:g793.t1
MVKGWPRWAIPGFLDEVPPRLDLCRQRLLAAEIELGRAEKAGGLDIGDSAPEKAESVPAVLQDLPPLAGPDDGPDEFAHLPHEGEMLLEQVSELEAQLSSTEVKFKDLETSHAAARQQRNAYSSQLDSSTEQISALAARIAALAGELDTSQQHNQELKGKIVASRANTQKLQQQLLKSDREVAHARYENCKLEEFLQSTRGVAEDFRDRLEVSEAEQDKLRARIRELQESNEAVREDANQRIEELEEALQEADSSIEELQQEKETLEQNRNRLAESLQAQKEQTSAQEQLVASLRQQQVQEERSKAAVQKQLDGKEKEVEELQKQLERMAQTIEEAEQSRAAAEERAAAPQEPPDTAAEVAANEKAGNQRIEELEEALRQQQMQEERSKAAIQKQLEGKDKEVEELQKQLSMGAVLALNLAFNQPKLVEALCLINPATSYRRTPLSLLAPLLPSLPENLYETLPAVITPLVGRVGWYEGVISSQQVDSAGSSPLENFLRISRGLSKALPPETLRFRESLLRKGLRRLEPRMADPPAIVTLLVAGDADAVLPSVSSFDFTLHFLAAFVKSWLLIGTTSELLRFCYLLSVDAWRVEMFEAYRRALCFASFAEIAAGTLYVCGWPAPIQNWRKVADVFLQFAIHLSLDIFPIIMVAVDLATWNSNFELSSAMLAIACIHVILFWAAWTIGDLALKVKAFSAACRAKVLKVSHLGTATRVLPLVVSDDEKESENENIPGWDLQNTFVVEEMEPTGRLRTRSMTIAVAGPFQAEEVDMDADTTPAVSSTSEPIPARGRSQNILVNENVVQNAQTYGKLGNERPMDLCLPVCVFLFHLVDVFPLVLSFVVILFGSATGHRALVFLGLETAVLIILGMLIGKPKPFTLSCWSKRSKGSRLKYLQEWGDSFCGLGYSDQLHSRMPFIYITFLLGILAGALDWWYSMFYCAATLLLCFVVQTSVLIQRPWAWLFGLLESFVLMIVASAILWASPVLTPAQDCGLVFALFLCRQFCLKRTFASGSRIQLSALLLLCTFQMALVTVISCCIANHRTVGSNPMFCDRGLSDCQYYDVPYIGDFGGRWPICEIGFSTAPFMEHDLTLADFALMSAFTYEPPSHVPSLLQQYFPNWRVSYKHIPIMLTGTFDWTSFYEFTAGDNSTTVFAVRGTTDMFDALQDMDLWLPVGMMYVFERLGPSVIQLWGPGIAWICRHVYVQQDGNFSLSFLNLLNMVTNRMTSYPNRTYYITGHSLGGGIAKLVAAEALRRERLLPGTNVEMTAVAFAAPGIGVAEALLFGVAHACFDDVNNVNLLSLLTDAGITQRLTQAKVSTPSLTPKTWLDRSLLQARSWVSPVFLSTAHGRVMPGLPVVDAETPLLLVGNHQLFSLDGIFIVEEFLREQQRLVTAMVYPPLLDDSRQNN